MAGINHMLANLDSVNFNEAIEDAFYDIAPEVVKQQKDQLLHGQLSSGEKTGTYKNPKYAAKKFAMNPLAGEGHKDYKLSGDFQAGLFVDVRNKSIVLASSDPKAGTVLGAEYNDGEDILGLNQQHISNVVPDLQAAAVKKITNQILK